MSAIPMVFVVEDDPEMARCLGWLLESRGLNVCGYSTGAEFLRDYQPESPGCVVLDVQLPDMSGLEVHRAMRERGGCQPTIMVTAYGTVPLAVEAMRDGAFDFFEKPFRHEQFVSRVREALDRDLAGSAIRSQAARLRERVARLTPREREVAEMVVEGKASKQIARILGIAVKTVEVHRFHIMRKLQAASSSEVGALLATHRLLGDQRVETPRATDLMATVN